MISRTSTTLLDGLHDPADDRAWRRFYQRYTPMLLSYAKRSGLSDADAQDAVAETLVVFVKSYRTGAYDRRRARLKSWLGGIARHKILKQLGRRRVASLDADESDKGALPEPAADEPLDDAFEHEWRLDRLNEALAIVRRESDPTTFQAFDLYAVKGWPVGKVTALLNVTPNVVYISKTRTVKRLRRVVRELGEAEERGRF